MPRNLGFDFFRGLMALLVCLGHYDHWTGRMQIPLSFVLAVDFFLVLSGFVLAASIWHRPATGAGDFLRARYQRLLPVYLVTILLTLPFVVWWLDLTGPTLRDILHILTFGQMLTGPTSPFTTIEPVYIAWSLSAELWVGLVLLPAAIALLRRAPVAALTGLAALAVGSLATLATYSPSFLDVHYAVLAHGLRLGILRCVMDYALGVLAFYAVLRLRPLSETAQSMVQTGCIAFALAAYVPLGYDRQLDDAAPPLFAAFIGSLASQSGVIYRLTDGKLAAGMGDISYPLYLIHPLFIVLFASVFRLTGTPWAMALYLAACILAALILNRLVERPCIAFFKRRAQGKAATKIAAPPS